MRPGRIDPAVHRSPSPRATRTPTKKTLKRRQLMSPLDIAMAVGVVVLVVLIVLRKKSKG